MKRPSLRKEMAVKAVLDRGISVALACRTFSISECCYRYERKLSDENAEIADWLEKLTIAWQGIENAREGDNRRTWGFGLCFLYLRNVKGFGWNITRQAYAKHRREGTNVCIASIVNWS